jgi:DNA-binding response OmpR family regulator
MMSKTILVVEDDADQRLGYRILLNASGYGTIFAVDSKVAMEEARHHRPDLIILDLGLLAGDGFMVLERLRASSYLAATPVIVVSARDPQVNEARALAAGARAYVQKPWDDRDLLALIAQLLGAIELAPT